MVIWLTGLSGSGKTTLCNSIWDLLKPDLPQLVMLDGDAVRSTLGEALGYRQSDRVAQITRIQNLAKMLSDQELVVLVAALYSDPDLMNWNRQNIEDYFEVYVEASLDALQTRDTKGLYRGAANGSIPNVVGVDIPWNIPQNPDLIINNDIPEAPDILARKVIEANSSLKSLMGKI